MIKLNLYTLASAVKAASLFSGVKDVRQYLNGVHLMGVGQSIVVEATCGHTAFRVSIQTNEYAADLDHILYTNAAAELSRLMPFKKFRHVETCSLAWDETHVSVASEEVYNWRACRDRFPDLDRVLHAPLAPIRTPQMATAGFKAEYIERMAKAAKLLGHPKHHGFEMCSIFSPTDRLFAEIPTDHGDLPGISLPAKMAVMPARL